MHKIQLKWTKKSLNKVAKQQIFIKKKTLGLRLFYLLTMKKWIFRTKTTYLKILKAKDQLQASHPQPAMIHHLAIFNNWSMQESSFKQIKIHKLNSQKIQKTAHKCLFMVTIDPEKLYQATFICQYGLCLLNRIALVSVRLFCKNLGNLQEFFGQMVYPPSPLPGKNWLPVRLWLNEILWENDLHLVKGLLVYFVHKTQEK